MGLQSIFFYKTLLDSKGRSDPDFFYVFNNFLIAIDQSFLSEDQGNDSYFFEGLDLWNEAMDVLDTLDSNEFKLLINETLKKEAKEIDNSLRISCSFDQKLLTPEILEKILLKIKLLWDLDQIDTPITRLCQSKFEYEENYYLIYDIIFNSFKNQGGIYSESIRLFLKNSTMPRKLVIEICNQLKYNELVKINFLLNNNLLNEDIEYIINLIPDRLTEHMINIAMDKKFFIYSKENFRLMEKRAFESNFLISQQTIDKLVNHPNNIKTAKDILIVLNELKS